MLLEDLRLLVEPDLTRKGLKWDNVAWIEFYPQYYEVTLYIRGFNGKIMLNRLKNDAYKSTIRFEYKELDHGLVEDQGVQEQSGEEAPKQRHFFCRCDSCNAPRDGNTSRGTREGPGDGPQAQARQEAAYEEAEAGRGDAYNAWRTGWFDKLRTPCGPRGEQCTYEYGPCRAHTY